MTASAECMVHVAKNEIYKSLNEYKILYMASYEISRTVRLQIVINIREIHTVKSLIADPRHYLKSMNFQGHQREVEVYFDLHMNMRVAQ